MDCNTCFATTRYNWLVQYSNDDEKTIVEDAGQDACTICYPSAPAEVLNRPSRIVTADKVAKAKAKAEREAKKAEKIAKEKANAPTKSGEFLYFKEGKYTEVIKTERSAVSKWFNNQYWILNSSNPESQESKKQVNEIICKNLAEKNGVSFDQQLKILETKYKKRGNQ
jgi:CO dehydrogenase/acetyl-CoA synthase beta subunit